MTAAPGPQQPDEVRPRISVELYATLRAAATDLGLVHGRSDLGQELRSLIDWHGARRPAAPSAQRDEQTSLCPHRGYCGPNCTPAQPDRSLSQHRRLAVQNPAQPDEVGIDCTNRAHGLCLIPGECACVCHNRAGAVLVAAPSAQPDEDRCRCWHGTASGRCREHGILARSTDPGGDGWACACPRTPAQPVRDTEEGRR